MYVTPYCLIKLTQNDNIWNKRSYFPFFNRSQYFLFTVWMRKSKNSTTWFINNREIYGCVYRVSIKSRCVRSVCAFIALYSSAINKLSVRSLISAVNQSFRRDTFMAQSKTNSILSIQENDLIFWQFLPIFWNYS